MIVLHLLFVFLSQLETLLSESSLFELNSLAARQDLLTLAAQQLNCQLNVNTQRNRQRPPKIEGNLEKRTYKKHIKNHVRIAFLSF